MPTVAASFTDRATADRAVDDLLASGISPDDISVLVSNSTRERYFANQNQELDKTATRGAVGGGVTGAGLGAIVGGLLLGGAATVATGGIAAPFLIAGPLAGALTGGTGGAAVGTILGGLLGAGVTQHVAENLDQGIRQGALVVAVHATDENARRVEELLHQHEPETVVPPTDAPIPPT